MPLDILADTFVSRHDHEITAIVSLVLAGLAVLVVDRALDRRGRRLALAVAGGELSPVAATRLRFVRRVVDATIVGIGVAVALSQFTALDRLAGAILASGAIAAAVIGFAARQTLANAIAGLLIAITQPLRIGDLVTFEGETGTVEDVRLTYTWLRTGSDARVIVPNERLAAGVLRNESIGSPTVAVEATIWLAHGDDETAALDAIHAALPEVSARIAEVTVEGTRILVIGAPAAPADRPLAESDLRLAALRAIRERGARRD
jgi:small-conductance mechanosensitive channel